MWGFSAHDKTLDLPTNLAALSGQDAKAAVNALMADWHPALRRLVQTADVSTITAFAVKTSMPIAPWATQKVTLLGLITKANGLPPNWHARERAVEPSW
jgi:hypothetical protein